MSIINFSIPQNLAKRIESIMQTKGFSSKAEFFRFSALYFIDIIEKPITNETERFDYLTSVLSEEIRAKYHGKKIPSAREQLKDL